MNYKVLAAVASALLLAGESASATSMRHAPVVQLETAEPVVTLPQASQNLAPPDLVAPKDSLVRFEVTDKAGVSHFSGRFVLRGTFIYFRGGKGGQLVVVPDADVAARLPTWVSRDKDGPDAVYIYKPEPFIRAHIPAAEKAQVLKIGGQFNVHAAVEVDSFTATYVCKGKSHAWEKPARYTARLVGTARSKPAPRDYPAPFPCGD